MGAGHIVVTILLMPRLTSPGPSFTQARSSA